MAKRTLFVNLFGGPGSGKSTIASGLFSKLKLAHVRCELVREYATELVWLEASKTLDNQVYVTAKQYHWQLTKDGKVDVVVTDSPIILGLVYRGKRGCGVNWQRGVVDQFKEFDNLNFNLVRDITALPYDLKGRRQTLDQAIHKDVEIRRVLDEYEIPYHDVSVSGPEVIDKIMLYTMNHLREFHDGYLV
jgi:hypothetical protein